MNIPKVGQKYVCVSEGWGTCDTGDIIEATAVDVINGGVLIEYSSEKGIGCWSVNTYPNDFKLVQESDDVHHDVHDAITYMYSCLSKPPVDGGKPPLGLQSWQAHDSLRVQDILAAMQRYVAANKAVPEAWLEELIDKIELEYE